MPLFKRREAKTASSPPLVALSQTGSPFWSRRDPQTLIREGFEHNAIVYRCIRLIAENAASVNIRIDPANSGLARLLSTPNAEMNGTDLTESLFGHIQTAGNAFIEAVSVDGEPRQLHVLRPDRMHMLKDRQGRFSGWVYRVNGQERQILPQADGWSSVLHFKLLNPGHDYYGHAPLAAAARAIDIHNAGGAWAKALMDNSARPSGALIYGREGASLTSEQFNRLKTELQDAHSGVSNAGRPLLLEGGLDWKPMSLSPAEMDYIEARNAAAREIALAFGVPPMLLGLPGDNTYANYREANLAFWRLSVLPLVTRLCRSLRAWLSPRFADAPELVPDIDSIIALSSERESLWNRLENASFLSIDEKRQRAGLPPQAPDASGSASHDLDDDS